MNKNFSIDNLPGDVMILEPRALDKCILGFENNKLIYSYGKLIEYFHLDEGMVMEDALEWVSFNIMPLTVVDIWDGDDYL